MCVFCCWIAAASRLLSVSRCCNVFPAPLCTVVLLLAIVVACSIGYVCWRLLLGCAWEHAVWVRRRVPLRLWVGGVRAGHEERGGMSQLLLPSCIICPSIQLIHATAVLARRRRCAGGGSTPLLLMLPVCPCRMRLLAYWDGLGTSSCPALLNLCRAWRRHIAGSMWHSHLRYIVGTSAQDCVWIV